jgi:hypothetical protein
VPDVLAVSWVVLAGIAVILPALIHGIYLGPFDILSRGGLTAHSGVVVHDLANSDLANEIIPWTDLSWIQVHHGQLPLWNPYNGLGMPLAFNWQSASFSLPAAIGYLVPMRFAFDAGVVVTLVVSGTGAYVFARVLGLGVVACAFAGVIFELSGPMIGWLGYPLSGVMSWAGWLFAAVIFVIRDGHRVVSVAACAVIVALAIYAGQPEALAALGLSVLIFVLVILVWQARSGGLHATFRPLIDLTVGCVAGAALAAPLALPGLQLIGGSERSVANGAVTLPPHAFLYLIAQGFDGLPIAGSFAFGDSFFYQETAAYVGVAAVALAISAVIIRYRRPVVVALGAIVISCLGIVFTPGVSSLLALIPAIGQTQWLRMLMPLAFALAILAAIGLDAITRAPLEARSLRVAGWMFGTVGVALVLVLAFGRGSLPWVLARIRWDSLIWPGIETVVGLVGIALLWWSRRATPAAADAQHGTSDSSGSSHRLKVRMGAVVGAAFLLCQTVFLVTAGGPIASSSDRTYPQPASIATLRHVTGSSNVGFGVPSCTAVGVVPNANIAYEIHEFAIYDASIPKRYYTAWKHVTGSPGGFSALFTFCPGVNSSDLARRFGVVFVLEPKGAVGPTGGVFVRSIGSEDLYRIPGSGPVTATPLEPGGGSPPDDRPGVSIPVDQPNSTTWRVSTAMSTPQVLRFHLTDVPGWNASIDGRPLALHRYSGIMMQAVIPAGHHLVVLRYWPSTLSLGIVLALICVLALISVGVVGMVRRRRGDPAASVRD